MRNAFTNSVTSCQSESEKACIMLMIPPFFITFWLIFSFFVIKTISFLLKAYSQLLLLLLPPGKRPEPTVCLNHLKALQLPFGIKTTTCCLHSKKRRNKAKISCMRLGNSLHTFSVILVSPSMWKRSTIDIPLHTIAYYC